MDHHQDFQSAKKSEDSTFPAADEDKPKRLASAKKKLQDYKKSQAKSSSHSTEETPSNVNIDTILTPEPSPPLYNFSNGLTNNEIQTQSNTDESPDVVSCSSIFGPEIPGQSLFENIQPNYFIPTVDPSYVNYTVFPVQVNQAPKKPCIPKEKVDGVNQEQQLKSPHPTQTHTKIPINGAPMPPPPLNPDSQATTQRRFSNPSDNSNPAELEHSKHPGPCIPKEGNETHVHGHSVPPKSEADANDLGLANSRKSSSSYRGKNSISKTSPSPIKPSKVPVVFDKQRMNSDTKAAKVTPPCAPPPPPAAQPCVPSNDTPDLLTLTSSKVGTNIPAKPEPSELMPCPSVKESHVLKDAASQSDSVPDITPYQAAKLHQQAFLNNHSVSPESELELLQLKNDNKHLHQRNADLLAQLQKMESVSNELRSEIEILKKSKIEAMASHLKISHLVEENTELKKTIETLNLELAKTISDKHALEANLEKMTNAVAVISHDKLNLSEQLHSEKEKLSLLEPALSQKASELEVSVVKNKKLEQMVAELNSKLEGFMKDGQEEKHLRSVELLQAEAKIMQLEKELMLLKGQVEKGGSRKDSRNRRSSRDSDDDDSRGRRHHHHHRHHHHSSRDYEDTNLTGKSSESGKDDEQNPEKGSPGPCTEGDTSFPGQSDKLSDVEEAVENEYSTSCEENDSDDHEHCHDHDHHHHEHDRDGVPGDKPSPLEKKLAHLQWENANYREELDRLAVLLKSSTVDSETLHKYQDENERMKSELTRLEHLVVQLQSENDTIADYIALYQTQRLALKEKAREKDVEMATLSQERETLRVKMEELNSLLRAYKKEDAPIEKINELISEINSNFHPCSVCSGRLLTV